jgi:hypothetical protein
MTREQMLEQIDRLRGEGHLISLLGVGPQWVCLIDTITGEGGHGVEAYQTARAKFDESKKSEAAPAREPRKAAIVSSPKKTLQREQNKKVKMAKKKKRREHK